MFKPLNTRTVGLVLTENSKFFINLCFQMSEGLKTHICTEFTKHIGFTTEKGLTKHSRDDHGPHQKCPYCEFTYAISREDNLRRHIRIKHLSDSATRSTMDSRVVIDTSNQGVTGDTELGS